jgi:hypothetical protein
MQTLIKFFVSLVFALVVGILPVPSKKSVIVTSADCSSRPSDFADEGCCTLLHQDAQMHPIEGIIRNC